MVELKKMNREEVNSKPFLINQIYDLYGDIPGEFYSYQYEGEERWLYRDNLYCTILCLEGKYLAYTSFMINEDYEPCYMEFGDMSAALNSSGEMFLWKEDSSVAGNLKMQKRNEASSVNDLDGIVINHQLNTETGEDVLISYKTMYREEPQFYQSMFMRPFIITFFKNGKAEQYLQYTTSSGYTSYDIITIKEFGLMEFLQNGSYALQKDSSITRYFKIKGQKEDGTCILLYPFSRAYTIEEMDKMLEEKGFSRNIDEDIIDYYNGNYEEIAEYKVLIEAIKNYDKSHLDEKALLKKVSDGNENN
ncbi:MAG: hypothetical protein K2H20_00600 [Bacilli bacterium]|nr:hypothetical protein [Bacilli bacterium]